MSKLLLTVFTAIGVLSACTTDTGMTYTAQKLNIAGQPQAYRVTCSSLLGSQKSCMSAASRICKDQQVVAVQAFDSSKGAFDFTCAGGPPAKPAA